jgi:hypothetical protein
MFACEPIRDKPRFTLVTFADYYKREKKEGEGDNDDGKERKKELDVVTYNKKIIYFNLIK